MHSAKPSKPSLDAASNGSTSKGLHSRTGSPQPPLASPSTSPSASPSTPPLHLTDALSTSSSAATNGAFPPLAPLTHALVKPRTFLQKCLTLSLCVVGVYVFFISYAVLQERMSHTPFTLHHILA